MGFRAQDLGLGLRIWGSRYFLEGPTNKGDSEVCMGVPCSWRIPFCDCDMTDNGVVLTLQTV